MVISAGAGGIAGFSQKEIKQCYNTGIIEAKGQDSYGQSIVGGIVGDAYINNTINSCYNTGEVKGDYMLIGGITGNNYKGAKINNSYNAFLITENSGKGIAGISGGFTYDSTDINNCYYIGTTTSGSKLKESDMKTANFINLIGGTSIWKLDTENKNKGFVIFNWQ